MRKKTIMFIRLTGLVLGVLSTPIARAQTVYAPVPLTGFTDDVVANVIGAANLSATNDMDGGNNPTRYCFLTQNYRNPAGAAPTTFLPATGFFHSAATPALPFQLADYNANNTMRIKGIGNGTLTFNTPRAARILYLLGGSGNSQLDPTNFTATINFTDGTSQVFNNLFFKDWFGMLDVVALQGVSRVNFDTNVIESSNINPSLYQKPLVILPANYGKLIRSVSFVKPAAFGTLNVLAISAGAGCTSPPAGGKALVDITTICSPTNVNLSLSGAAADPELTYQWQFSTNNGTTWTNIPGATNNTHLATPAQTTQYRARLICGVLTGTSAPVSVILRVPVAQIKYLNSTYCQAGKSFLPIVSPTGGTFAGETGLVIDAKTGMIDLEASAPGRHKITYTTAGQCPVEATTTIRIEEMPKPVFPNIITPNGDGLNDQFLVPLSAVSEYRMRIFSRWGRQIWENTDPTIGWPGTNDGTYYYHVQIKDCAGNTKAYKGYLEVVH
jgi:gliding motility-associated-like protein